MKTLLIGLLIGGAAGFAVQKFALADDAGERRDTRRERVEEGATSHATDHSALIKKLRERIAELEARPAAAAPVAEVEDLFNGVAVPEDMEGAELLLAEFSATTDLDRFLALVASLLRQGKFKKLTSVIMRMVGIGMSGRLQEEELMKRAVPALKVAMGHEKQIVEYVGWLLTNDEAPPMFRPGAIGAAMVLSLNKVKGTEKFQPMLIKQFMKQSTEGSLRAGEETGMLISVMGMMGGPEAVEPLVELLGDEKLAKSHHRVVEALGNLRDDRAVPALIERLRNQQSNSWWQPEVGALGKIGTPAARRAAEDHLARLKDDNKFFNQAGAYLQQQPDSKVFEMVRDRYRRNPKASNLWSVVRALGRIDTPDADALLGEIGQNTDQDWIKNQVKQTREERKKLKEQLAEAER